VIDWRENYGLETTLWLKLPRVFLSFPLECVLPIILTPITKHPDAIGHLNDLSKEVGQDWFKMLCDCVAINGLSALDDDTYKTLYALFRKRASYLRLKPTTGVVAPAAAATASDFLESLSAFSNFKKLESTLGLTLTKRITLLFGANSSGKSSLCESLKVLASPETPSRPLENVRRSAVSAVSFGYKFRSDTTPQNWTPAVGYGLRTSTVKYFDTGIALKNVKHPVEPGRIIELTPFKLHVFEWLTVLTTQFRDRLQEEQASNATRLREALEGIRAQFSRFKGRLLASIDQNTLVGLAAEIKLGEAFSQLAELSDKQLRAADLEKALSEEGLKLLGAEHRDLQSFLSSLNKLLDAAEELWKLDPAAKATDLAAKISAQQLLAKTLIPEGATLEKLLAILRATNPICDLSSAAGHACPLCKRPLTISEVDLFKQYHDLLTGELEKEITAIRSDLGQAEQLAKTAHRINRDDWDKSILPTEALEEAKRGSELIVESCDLSKEPTEEAKHALASLRILAARVTQQMREKAAALEAARTGEDELRKQLVSVQSEVENLEYEKSISDHLRELRQVETLHSEDKYWHSKLPPFTPLLKKITDASKKANEELVVADFETRLNAEYKALTEKPMTSFGVTLARKGSESSVTVLPQIGGKEIEGVLCEGEQRVHALALFFAELETCPQSVVVFDDPISSFDYNHIANYCIRIRDFAVNHPDHQLIILTHNWEFFVQLQTTINAARLNHALSVQVLENCAIVGDYSEKIGELKTEIGDLLALAGEPTKAQKEDLAGKLRRLIEAVVNTHVFNNQRHQYKQKNQPVSEFQSFTKLVPLLQAEATTLRDLYAKLSVTEHDDPRTAYVNTDKATFQVRYDQVLSIEAAIEARK
jgi:recombinational DNA repair ATPase RecF